MNRQQLRADLRQRRAAVKLAERQTITAAVTKCISELPVFIHAKNIAAYLATPEELDPLPLLQLAFAAGKQCYLPILNQRMLRFAVWTPTTPLHANRLGILEPAYTETTTCEPEQLELVIVPMVGFDANCNRLGMGGGFYDRSFAFMQTSPPPPYLLGIAMECQRCSALSHAAWDVKMHSIITEAQHYQCHHENES